MTFTADSKLVARIVPSPAGEVWSRGGVAIQAVMIHMAQGGGTENHLDNLDGNSSHYVIKYSGELVQMVPESKAAGSVNPDKIRTADDSPFTNYEGVRVRYGITALKACIGGWAKDPNRAVIAIEIEGFAGANTSTAADREGGPNDKQEATLVALVADIRRRRGALPVCGHRDAQDYKACPGKRIPWGALGGHASQIREEIVGPEIKSIVPFRGVVTIVNDGIRNAAIRMNDGKIIWLPEDASKEVVAKVQLVTPWPDHPSGVGYVVGDSPAILLAEDVTVDEKAVITADEFADALDTAIALDRLKARVTWE